MNLSKKEKRNELIRKKLCFLCLSKNHHSNVCQQNLCPNCNGRHHVTLCENNDRSLTGNSDSMGILNQENKIQLKALVVNVPQSLCNYNNTFLEAAIINIE